jgi:hypothetical protein
MIIGYIGTVSVGTACRSGDKSLALREQMPAGIQRISKVSALHLSITPATMNCNRRRCKKLGYSLY